LRSDKPSYGKPVVFLLPDGTKKAAVLSKGGATETKYGAIAHDEVVRSAWGASVKTAAGAQVIVLKPTLYDVQMLLAKRATQVIYPKDSSFMVALSGVGPGSLVVEIGTGSGFLTMVLACAVRPSGRVISLDVKKEYIEVAKSNLELTECADVVEFYQLDGREGIPAENVDAVFADIPDPWNALKSAHEALADGGSFLAFLPTTNQVSKLLKEAESSGLFCDLRVYEVSVREYQPEPEALRPYSVQVAHTGYIVFMRKARHSY